MNTERTKTSRLIPSQAVQKLTTKPFPQWFQLLFLNFAVYMAMPIVDVPLIGLSFSALVFMPLSLYVIIRPSSRWFREFQQWIFLAAAIWIGFFLSSAFNGILNSGTGIDMEGISNIIHYAYWLLVFVITAYYFYYQGKLKLVSEVLGWSVMALGLLRWVEVALYENIGAWTGTHLMSQNTYGFLFSTFSPFLLFLVIDKKGVGENYCTFWLRSATRRSCHQWLPWLLGVDCHRNMFLSHYFTVHSVQGFFENIIRAHPNCLIARLCSQFLSSSSREGS